jgi:RNA recognition motif-containing protein
MVKKKVKKAAPTSEAKEAVVGTKRKADPPKTEEAPAPDAKKRKVESSTTSPKVTPAPEPATTAPTATKKLKNKAKKAGGTEETETTEVPSGGEFKVYVAGFPAKQTDSSMLRKTFQRFGEVKEVAIPPSKKKRSKGIAFITFASKAAQTKALEADGLDFEGSSLQVQPAGQKAMTYTISVEGFGPKTTEESLRARLSKCGEIASLEVLKAHNSAIIRFKARAAVEAALKLNGQNFEGKNVTVKEHKVEPTAPNPNKKPKVEVKASDRIYVSGLAPNVDETSFRKHFEAAGKVKHLVIPKDKDSVGRGIALITFETKEAADASLKLDGRDFGGRKLRVVLTKSKTFKGGKSAKKKQAEKAEQKDSKKGAPVEKKGAPADKKEEKAAEKTTPAGGKKKVKKGKKATKAKTG